MSCHGAAAESRVGRLGADSLVTIYISLVGCVCVLPFSGNPLSTLNLLAPAPASAPPPCCPSSTCVQGLAEVLAVMGAAHLSELLPELLASATSKNPFVREGHLTLFR